MAMGGWCGEAIVVLLLAGAMAAGAVGREEAGRVFLKGGDVSLLAERVGSKEWGQVLTFDICSAGMVW